MRQQSLFDDETLPVPPMKLGAIAPWFGGKRTQAPGVVEELGRHKCYFEPFCGSAAVLFAKEPSGHETVNDLHGGLICLARVLADDLHAVHLYERLSKTLFSEQILDEAQEHLTQEPPWWFHDAKNGEQPGFRRADANMAEYAYWYFVASWMARNGNAGTERIVYQPAVRSNGGGGSPTTRWRSAIDSIPAWHHRLKNVVILNRDAFEIIPKFEDAPSTAIYCDPPYMASTRSGCKQESGRYKHDFWQAQSDLIDSAQRASQHVQLAKLLRQFQRARIVVSYYDCEAVRDLYPGWTVVDRATKKKLIQTSGNPAAADSAPEILLVNGPSYSGSK